MKKNSILRAVTLPAVAMLIVIVIFTAIFATLREAKLYGYPFESYAYSNFEMRALQLDYTASYYMTRAEESGGLDYYTNAIISRFPDIQFVENYRTAAVLFRARYGTDGSLRGVEDETSRKIIPLARTANVLYFSCYSDEALTDFLGWAEIDLDKQLGTDMAAELCCRLIYDSLSWMACEWRIGYTMSGGEMIITSLEYVVRYEGGQGTEKYETLWHSEPAGSETAYTSSVQLRTKGNGRFSTRHMDDGRDFYKKTMLAEWEKTDAMLAELDGYIARNFSANISETEKYNLFKQRYVWKTIVDDPESTDQSDVLILTTMVTFSPLLTAIYGLWRFYLMLLLLALAAFLFIYSAMKKRVSDPLRRINDNFAAGFKRTNIKDDWRKCDEIITLADHYDETMAKLDDAESERLRMEKAVEYADEAEQNRRKMTSNIAHELKTPLAIIHGCAESLNEHVAEEKREHYLEMILSETERMDAMVLDMLDLSRMEAGRTKLRKTVFPMNALTREVFGRLEKAVAVKSLSVEIDAEEEITVTADRDRVEQAVMNYAANAVRHTPPGGVITVKIERYWQGARFSIENDGAQIEEEIMDKLWESFYRADEARDRSQGSGLGLAIVKNIVELHGGKYGVSNTDRGVRFWFTI